MPATVEPAGDVLLVREDIARAWKLASPHLHRMQREIECAYPTAQRELLIVSLVIALRTCAEASGYSAGFAAIVNEIVCHDERFRWRLIDVQN